MLGVKYWKNVFRRKQTFNGWSPEMIDGKLRGGKPYYIKNKSGERKPKRLMQCDLTFKWHRDLLPTRKYLAHKKWGNGFFRKKWVE